jgi:hypothetical protein
MREEGTVLDEEAERQATRLPLTARTGIREGSRP